MTASEWLQGDPGISSEGRRERPQSAPEIWELRAKLRAARADAAQWRLAFLVTLAVLVGNLLGVFGR
jgi:hypothetical protein